jgi:AcrR family transcriptional regulator
MASDVKKRLLAAAIGVFARKGYRSATIAELCEAAGANIAAVNYHFTSKENLFRHVLRESFTIANLRYPIDGGLAADAPAEKRLRAFMDALIRRSLDSGLAGDFSRIMAHTGTREAAPDDVVLDEVRRLEGETLNPILAELLGTRQPALVAQARLNVIGLSIFPSRALNWRRELLSAGPASPKIRTLVDRQFRFALAGLAALRPKPTRRPARK